MSQLAIKWAPADRVGEARRKVLLVLNNIVDAVGLMVAAGACGARTQDLSDALGGTANRYVRIEWVFALLDLCDRQLPDYRNKLAEALVGWIGLQAVSPNPMSAEEKNIRIEATLERHGALGKAILDEALGGRR